MCAAGDPIRAHLGKGLADFLGFVCCYLFLYLFMSERQREPEQGRGRQRERDTHTRTETEHPKQAPCCHSKSPSFTPETPRLTPNPHPSPQRPQTHPKSPSLTRDPKLTPISIPHPRDPHSPSIPPLTPETLSLTPEFPSLMHSPVICKVLIKTPCIQEEGGLGSLAVQSLPELCRPRLFKVGGELFFAPGTSASPGGG